MLTHKGYIGKVEYDDEAEIFHGDVINTRDVITFQADTAPNLKQAFIDSVEDYLEFCEQSNEEPDKPFSGQFMLRVDPDVHRRAYIASKLIDKSLNSFVSEVLDTFLDCEISNIKEAVKFHSFSQKSIYDMCQKIHLDERQKFRRHTRLSASEPIRLFSRKLASGS